MLRFAAGLLLLVLVVMTGLFAFELSYSDSTFGGHLPFGALTVAPLLAFFAGRVSH